MLYICPCCPILAVLCYKNEQTDILLIPPQYEENLYKTSYRNNNAGLDAFYVKSDNIRFSILCFEFGCPYVHPDGKFRPRVFKLIYMDYITFGESHSD